MAADDPSDEEVRAAIGAHLTRFGRRKHPAPALEDLLLTRSHLLEGTITRRVEDRTEQTRHRPGTISLSDRPTYDVLRDYKLGPGESPLDRPLDLVKRGTVHLRSCDCGNGRRQCADCRGMTYRPCEPARVCTVCQGVAMCTQYLKHGGLPSTPPRPPKPGKADRPAERVTCEGCHTPDSACPGCRGWGKVKCPECAATGRIPCASCSRTGTVKCTTCEGHGNLTSWTAGRIEWTRRSKTITPPVPRPRRIGSELDAGGWREDLLATDDSLPGDLSLDQRTALEPQLRRGKDERERQVVLRRLTVVQARLPGSSHLEFYVFRGTDGRLRTVRRLSQEGRWKASVIAGAVVALAILVLVLIR
ncbi:hypothetical protein [Streptomyces sp. NPDC059378]|uniref:hypothetical protein n=1 Tax=Streptomyces sp. NPDC059378 TaxID=3346815 RepID=UPI00369819AD